jgi:hypothetical protein
VADGVPAGLLADDQGAVVTVTSELALRAVALRFTGRYRIPDSGVFDAKQRIASLIASRIQYFGDDQRS